MNGVAVAFAVIGLLIGAGYLSARLGLISVNHGPTINRVAFYVFSPPLLFTALVNTSVEYVFSDVIVVVVISSLATALVFVILSRLFFPRGLADTTMGAASSIYLNSNNIGLPISVYVIGDVTYYAPLLIMQIVLFLPVLLAILEAARGRKARVSKIVISTLLNPLIVASALGFLVSISGLALPEIVLEPLSTMGSAAVPLLLFAYGMSLRGQKIFHADGDRPVSLTAIILKILVMPTLAIMIGVWVFHLPAHQLFAAVVLACLPTAQNMYTHAAVFRTETFAVRDVVFTTTIMSLPLMFLVATLLAA